MEVGEILMELRKEKNIGQKELAAYLRLSTGTISNYENGVHSPDLNTLCKLADYFEVTTDYLLNRTTYRYTSQKMEQRLNQEYTLSDVVDTVLCCDSSSVNQLMEYAQYLQYKKRKEEEERSGEKEKTKKSSKRKSDD